ncbi:MAG: threonine--tRNA ligase [Parvibaculum sp.]|uniref:threonine--tRNA ligase n=1 Tax=Parvibaculum sp. TaxID=2024848 RepID=UPI002732196F|nr:threonine--tRNA ligase [Parvibaculum sp.]MDP2151206.1 threonine--tRNA ligase [Parvibaculum sp.]
MPDITVKLPDGSEKNLPEGSTVADLAESIGPRLAAAALAGRVDGHLTDTGHVLSGGETVEIVTDKSPDALSILRHSAGHVMAEAVAAIFPMTKFGIGPSIEDGFYYDFEVERPFTPEDLDAIETRMNEIIAEELPFARGELTRLEAHDQFDGQPYKQELVDELPEDETISIYNQGNFTDLCRGPHVPHTGRIGAFKLMKVAGAYWRGDSTRPMLQRIYGTAWFSQKDLDAYLERIEEAKKRDHRKLGRELDLFSFHEEAGAGLPVYHPKGARTLRLLQEWLRGELYRRGYVEAITPHIYKADVWKISGHYDFYRENMYFFEIDEGDGRINEYAVKPMNCPGHVMIYGNDVRSYRDLPIRMFEFGTVYRHEMSGVVHGLLRARGFTQDDAHIFCTADQVLDEVVKMLELVDFVFGDVFGFEYSAEVSTRPEKSIGDEADWEHATASLTEALKSRGLAYDVNEGDGAFYGPKIDIKLRDAIGRTWQCSTIQVDFNLPERFDLTYRTADNSAARPFMLHRTILGSMERFFGILLEHYAGALPVWLAPVQAVIVPIADRHLDHAATVRERLEADGVRVEIYDDQEPMRVKIAKAQQQKVPYMLVIGDKEAEADTISVRDRTQGDIGAMGIDDFVEMVSAQLP